MGSSRIALMILFSVLTLTGCSSCGKVDGTKPSGQNEAKRTGNEPKEEPGPKTASKGKPGPKLDLKYLPADAFAAAFMFPKHLRSLPELELLPFEVMKAAIETETGLNPLDAEQAIVFLGPPNPPTPPEFGFIVRFGKRPVLAENLTSTLEHVKLGDVTVLRARARDGLSFCVMPDDTLLFARESRIRTMIAARNEHGPLHSLLSKSSTDAEITAVLTVAPVRELVRQVLQSPRPLPPGLREMLLLHEHLESAVVSLNVGSGRPTSIKLTAKNSDAAELVEKATLQGLALAKQMFLSRMSRELQQSETKDDPVQMATNQYVARLADAIESRLKPYRKGETVVISLNSDYAHNAVMVFLVRPALPAAREAARRSQSKNNLKQIALAMLNYNEQHGRLPARASYDGGDALLSWRVHILPFLGEQELYDQFHLDEPWNSEHNRQLMARMPAVYQSPNLPKTSLQTNYLTLVGEKTVFEGKDAIAFDEIKDRLDETILVVEADLGQAVIWTKPEDLTFDATAPHRGLGNLRPRGFLVALADGAASFVENEIHPNQLRALATIAVDEPDP